MTDDRLEIIRHHLYARGSASVQELCGATGASLATVRRDLQRLEDEGAVERTHGGVRLAETAGVELGFRVREKRNIAAKRAIARSATEMIRPQSTIFLDAGTTVLQVARLLRLQPMPLSVFTNGLAVAYELANVPDLRVSVIGGQLRNENLSFVGPQAERTLDDLWFDQLFMGFSAVHEDGSFHTLDVIEASLNRRMLDRTRQPVLLADSSKFDLHAPYRVATFAPGMKIITDEGLSTDWRSRVADLGADLVLAAGEVEA
ncbi:transcriptional regulator, DeoR family [Faunimonas pinastri]|uniref:Transcriptional regulator, DeoR family n=1 Tax=Faunimonas pinastri TaxID=1855383 RepID=A0A1H9IGU4_9HYPH|nr:DeoR/GlpR family DNA-binding transcription regulator [Faunimonas pinastri]SEQ73737.1 transcriptional regulator, DeoR family [Faunimonas pinastri]